MIPQDFYRTHSKQSDPRAYAYLFDALPDDLDSLCQVVRNVYVHYMSGRSFPDEHKPDVDLRDMDKILATIVARNDAPLTIERPPEQRFVGCCRDAALLLATMLRHKDIPARLRVGFAPYINLGVKDFAVDHVITEVWDASANRWKFVDAEQDAYLIEHNQIDFDVHDIPHDRFITGGVAWQQLRSGKIAPELYGWEPDDPTGRGEWPIRNRMLVDLLTLNKVELLLWDTWGWMNLDAHLSDEDLRTLDHIATLTLADDTAFEEIRAVYAESPLIKAPAQVMCYSPAAPWREVAIDV